MFRKIISLNFSFAMRKKRRSLQSEANALSNFVKEALLAAGHIDSIATEKGC